MFGGACPAYTETMAAIARTEAAPSPDRAARLAAGALGASLVAFAAWASRMPPGYRPHWQVNPLAAAQYRAILGVPHAVAADGPFRAGLAAGLLAVAAAYLALNGALFAGGALRPRRVLAASAILATALALFAPPVLSPDVYAYLGYARLAVVHHLDPYVATQETLVRLGDPTAPFLKWPISSPYGPLWTVVTMIPTALLARAPLAVQVGALRLVVVGALLALSAGGRRLAERLSPGSGPATLAALALNPLFIIEAAMNGHNDVAMMACLVWALVAAADQRWTAAFVLIGCAGAIKFLPLLLAPWLAARRFSHSSVSVARRLLGLAGAVALVAAPVALAYLPFWRGLATFEGLRHRWGGASGWLNGPWREAVALMSLYALVSWWVAARGLRGLVVGWTAISAPALLMLARPWFPWYWIWPWSTALVLRDRRGALLALALFCVAVALSLFYAA